MSTTTAQTDDTPELAEDPAAAQEEEAEQEGHYVTVSLCGKPARIVPVTAWRLSWQRMARAGDFDGLAEAIFHPKDVDLYYDLDPTIEQFNQFCSDAAELSGESMGKSVGPRPSTKRTRRK